MYERIVQKKQKDVLVIRELVFVKDMVADNAALIWAVSKAP